MKKCDKYLNKLPRSRADEVLLENIFCLEAELRGIKPLEIKPLEINSKLSPYFLDILSDNYYL